MIPQDELNPSLRLNFAPMVDFLFLTLTAFAVLAVSRSSLFEAPVALVTAKQTASSAPSHSISISIAHDGSYKLLTNRGEFPIQEIDLLQKELRYQHLTGNLPKDTHILLHIDKDAQWENVAKMIFSMKDIGFKAYPVFDGA